MMTIVYSYVRTVASWILAMGVEGSDCLFLYDTLAFSEDGFVLEAIRYLPSRGSLIQGRLPRCILACNVCTDN